ncbi:MAG: glycosyltransferase family 39 protein [Candidatus Peribacteraceae bacterium]
MPTFSAVRFTVAETKNAVSALPIRFPAKQQPLTLDFTIQIPRTPPALWSVRADDCLTSLHINEVAVPDAIIQPCHIDRWRHYELGSFFVSGSNTVRAVVQDTGGMQGFNMIVARSDFWTSIMRTGFLLSTVLLLILFIFRSVRTRESLWIISIVGAGIFVRLMYFDGTWFDERGNDLDGHIEYVKYVLSHWSIPPAISGWQFYQPPLYYFFAAGVAKIAFLFTSSDQIALRAVHYVSTVLSCVQIWFFYQIAALLFRQPKQQLQRILFFTFATFFPSFVIAGAQLNNDALLQFLAVLTILLLLKFWESRSSKHWFLICVVLGLSILTKSNALLLVPGAVLTLLLLQRTNIRRKGVLMTAGMLITLCMTSWLYAWRLQETADLKLIGNVGSLNHHLKVENTLQSFLLFHPISIIERPFANSWGGEDRHHFLEYYFRSAHFGEDSFPRVFFLARIVVTLSLATLFLAALSVFMPKLIDWRRAAPLFLVALSLFAGHMLFRWHYPYASSQHFRYSNVTALFFGYLSILSAFQLPRYCRGCMSVLYITAALLNAVLLLAITIR